MENFPHRPQIIFLIAVTELAGVAGALCTRIREVLGSNLSRYTGCHD
jgi:hypothetical protein